MARHSKRPVAADGESSSPIGARTTQQAPGQQPRPPAAAAPGAPPTAQPAIGAISASRTSVPDAPPPAPRDARTDPPWLFEVGWEVCWQLGGIYTVLRSKSRCMVENWTDRYFLIGPYNPATAAMEFEEQPTEGIIRQALDALRARGIPCHYGRWLVSGRPRVILLDYRARYGSLDADKYLLWKDHGIPSYSSDGEVNDVVAFGFTVVDFLRELCALMPQRPILAHFHEWMGGVAVPRIAHEHLPVATVFTTHATLLGRYLAADNPLFYEHLPFFDPNAEAGKYSIYPRYAIERAAAHAATVFTTVSEVTAFEAQKLLGRSADVVLPNGLNIQRFAALHEFQNLHRQYKERIHEFVMGHFFPSYTFDLDNTLYFFTAGRYEYRNKGMDLYVEALWRLNQRLRDLPDRPTIIAFLITRAATRNINVDVLKNQAMFDDLKASCRDIEAQMGRRLFMAAANGRIPTFPELINEDAQIALKRAIHVWRNHRQPLIVTHDLVDDAADPTLKHLRHRGLLNSAEDPVKLIFHPEFVTATSPLLNLDYDTFVRGCHMGIFPSYYEPWGYTPMECVALGVPTVTTDLSGFGAYVNSHIPDAGAHGVMVLNRRTRSFDESADDLATHLLAFCQLNRRQRIEQRNAVERTSQHFDWSALIQYYDQAHQLALERAGSAYRPGRIEIKVV